MESQLVDCKIDISMSVFGANGLHRVNHAAFLKARLVAL